MVKRTVLVTNFMKKISILSRFLPFILSADPGRKVAALAKLSPSPFRAARGGLLLLYIFPPPDVHLTQIRYLVFEAPMGGSECF